MMTILALVVGLALGFWLGIMQGRRIERRAQRAEILTAESARAPRVVATASLPHQHMHMSGSVCVFDVARQEWLNAQGFLCAECQALCRT